MIAKIIYVSSGGTNFGLINKVRSLFVIWLASWFCMRFVRSVNDSVIRRMKRRKKPIDRTLLNAVKKLINATIIIIMLLFTFQTLGFNMGGILAFGGFGGIAVGFAAKDLLANIFGVIMIYLDKPFKVGDWIRSPDRDIEGTVEDIGWRQTKIFTFDNRPLYIPNSVFSTISIENPSRMTHRRISETVRIRYEYTDKMDKIIDDIKHMLYHSGDIDNQETIIVNVNKFSKQSIECIIYAFTKTVDWVEFHRVKHRILMEIAKIIHNNGAEFATFESNANLSIISDKDKESDLLNG
jgi:MscS family membrane protein